MWGKERKSRFSVPLRESGLLFFIHPSVCRVIPLYDHIFPLTSFSLSLFSPPFVLGATRPAAARPPRIRAIYRGLISIAPPTRISQPAHLFDPRSPLLRLHLFTAIPIFPRLLVFDESLRGYFSPSPPRPAHLFCLLLVFASSFKPVVLTGVV